jgi:dTDP-glucose 4,6-dehydratase
MADRTLVTGGLGFIGSAYIRRLTAGGRDVLNVDLGTYAGDEARLEGAGPGKVRTVRLDVADSELTKLTRNERPDLIVHFAAESHVTRSERHEDLFFRSNVEGTRRLIEAAAESGAGRVVHVSTDEIYGPCAAEPFGESDKLPGEGRATSAYARSKALADDVALSFADRVGVIVVRPTNCFGPWQHPEKAVARWVTKALLGERIPVWGDGLYVRDWMFVEDACAGIDSAIARGSVGEAYNLAPEGPQRTNLEMARLIARASGRDEDAVFLTRYDRPMHDRRYAIDASKARTLGWRIEEGLEARLAQTVSWYRQHLDWWMPHLPEAERLYEDSLERGAI